MIKVWDSKDLEGIGEGKDWLRGRDLNPRPLGYEFKRWFILVHVVSSCSGPYLRIVHPGSWWFMLFLVLNPSEMLAETTLSSASNQPGYSPESGSNHERRAHASKAYPHTVNHFPG